MRQLMRRIVLSVILISTSVLNGSLSAQTSSTMIKVLDPSEVEGIPGVMLLINPGDRRKSLALVTDAKGEANTRDLNCVICTITAVDPHGSFVSRTTEFLGSSARFSLVLAIQPLLNIVGDPKAVSIEIAINDARGQPWVQHEVVIRPTVMTLENNRLSVQNTGPTGRVNVQLRAGNYTVATLTGDTISEAQFEIVTAKEQCSSGTATCRVVSPRASVRVKPISLRLSNDNDSSKPQ